MRSTCRNLIGANLLMATTLLVLYSSSPAQVRPKADPALPAATGKVVAYEADKSITVEVKQRGGAVRKVEFVIVKDKTKVELTGSAKAIELATEVKVWADKDDAKLAARIIAGTFRRVANPMPPVPRPPVKTPEANLTPSPPSAKVIPPAPIKPVGTVQAPAAVARAIDQEIQRAREAEKLKASPLADDAEFLRRVSIDIVGVIPSATQAAAFIESKVPDKRARFIDELLASPQYGRYHAERWSERIASRDMPVDKQPFIGWLADGLNRGRGWNEIVIDLVTAGGGFRVPGRGNRAFADDPQALFVLVNTEGSNALPAEARPQWLAAESARLFLGVQIQCAECHDHPFTKQWKQTDFWGLAAFYSQVRIDKQPYSWKESPPAADRPAQITIPAMALRSVGTVVPARFLGEGKDFQPERPELLRHTLARWLTSPDNPFFAQAAANRYWAHFFGRGLVNSVDDLRADNPASHPAVLQLLSDEFKKSGYDFKHLMRCICLTEAYQRTSSPQPELEPNQDKYGHQAVKIMGASVFYDSLKSATGWADLKLGLPERKPGLGSVALSPREAFAEFYRSSQGQDDDLQEYRHGIPQALKLLNAPQLNRTAPVVDALLRSDPPRERAIDQLYLAALARRPNAQEAKLMADFLARRKDSSAEQNYNAILWALINSSEFVLNH